MPMNDAQKGGLRPLIGGIGFLVLLVGVLTDIYSFNTGLLVALAVWILSDPILRVLGMMPEPGEDDEGRDHKHYGRSEGSFWSKAVWMIILFFVAVYWLIPTVFGTQLGLRGSGVMISEDRQVMNFSKVDISGSGVLIIDQSDVESLRVETDDNLINKIMTKVVGDTLKIYIDKPWYIWSAWPSSDTTYYLGIDDLERISTSGSSQIITDGLVAEALSMSVSGSSKAVMNLTITDLDVDITGSGEFNLSGTTVSQNIDISGSGKYLAKELWSKEAIIVISGSGNSIVNASDNLDVNISGSGKVEYVGSPSLTQKISGSGEISQYQGTVESNPEVMEATESGVEMIDNTIEVE